MRDGTTFDPDNPRLSSDGPPFFPPIDEGGEPYEPREEKNKNEYANLAVVAGYTGFMLSGCFSGSFETTVICASQGVAAGSAYAFLEQLSFRDADIEPSTETRGTRFLGRWNDYSALKKTMISSALALPVTLLAAYWSANTEYRPRNDPSFGQVAVELIKFVPCKIASQFNDSGFRFMRYLNVPAPR
jgi:hypothetical protein